MEMPAAGLERGVRILWNWVVLPSEEQACGPPMHLTPSSPRCLRDKSTTLTLPWEIWQDSCSQVCSRDWNLSCRYASGESKWSQWPCPFPSPAFGNSSAVNPSLRSAPGPGGPLVDGTSKESTGSSKCPPPGGCRGVLWPGCLQCHAAARRVQRGHLGHWCTGTASWPVCRLMCAWPLLCCNCCLLPKKPLLKMSPDFLHLFFFIICFLSIHYICQLILAILRIERK